MNKKIFTPILCLFICSFAVFFNFGQGYSYKTLFKERTLINASASNNTKILFNYLNTNYGKKMLSGQNVSTNYDNELEEIFNITGKYPAICSFDAQALSSLTLKYSQNNPLFKERIINWAKSGGIVAIQWHWLSPSGEKNTAEYPWFKSFYSKATDFDASKIFDSSSTEYQQMIDDMDNVAQFLLKLQQHDIPVLWRPLHEASGGWFWWGVKLNFGKQCTVDLQITTT